MDLLCGESSETSAMLASTEVTIIFSITFRIEFPPHYDYHDNKQLENLRHLFENKIFKNIYS